MDKENAPNLTDLPIFSWPAIPMLWKRTHSSAASVRMRVPPRSISAAIVVSIKDEARQLDAWGVVDLVAVEGGCVPAMGEAAEGAEGAEADQVEPGEFLKGLGCHLKCLR